ncbi:reverse transcriptase domain-containing protein [Tanacetum coccineum]
MSKYCHFHEDRGYDTNNCHQLRSQIEEAVKSGQLSYLVKGIKKERAKASENQRVEGKKDKGTTLTEAPILMIRQGESYTRDNTSEDFISKGREITFPSVTRGSNSSAPVIITAKIFGREDSNAENGNRSFHHPLSQQIPHCQRNRNCVLNIRIRQDKRRNEEGQRNAPSKQKRVTRTLQRKATRPPEVQCNVFAWIHTDMMGIHRTIMIEGKPFKTENKLNEYSHIKPIKQKRRGLGPDLNTAACKEVEELTKEGILRKVKHQTWVANPVMVMKSDGGWRMCVDFTDINKACPKDCYPLPEIDWKIQMAEGDEDKIAFFPGEGVFCYQKMPFGLKNVGATYQILVDKVFHDQIGRNLEAYVDDMVIKSTSEEDMLVDIKETLEKFRSINMKLNPKKCSFGVEEGPFLGHLITKKGIQASPSKVKAITDVEQLKTLKDIQILNGKLAALSCFLSKGAERSLPFFKTLKSCTDKKNIRWTQEAKAAL